MALVVLALSRAGPRPTPGSCELVREGRRHSWWRNCADDRRSAMPRHTAARGAPDVPTLLANVI